MTNASHNSKLTNVWPELKAEKLVDNGIELTLLIPNNLDYFKGHFPNAPILAGVVQLHWAVEFSKKHFDLEQYEVENLEVLKFQVVIIPEQELTLKITRKKLDKLLFTYTSERGQHSSGRIALRTKV